MGIVCIISKFNPKCRMRNSKKKKLNANEGKKGGKEKEIKTEGQIESTCLLIYKDRSIITINVNWSNTPVKRQWFLDWIYFTQEIYLRLKDTREIKSQMIG